MAGRPLMMVMDLFRTAERSSRRFPRPPASSNAFMVFLPVRFRRRAGEASHGCRAEHALLPVPCRARVSGWWCGGIRLRTVPASISRYSIGCHSITERKIIKIFLMRTRFGNRYSLSGYRCMMLRIISRLPKKISTSSGSNFFPDMVRISFRTDSWSHASL